ncbi:MAG: hypothetical protein OXH77_01015 [Anaerolineaceae bacterium]|nr:hypothetical protein [Anaerolineaceae bacterium]
MENVKHATGTRARYVGPTAARIAELIAPRQRVRFERGWFWTTAVCHGSQQDQLSFRQRPDGDGIDVRCRSAGCARERVIRSLEQLTGKSIWSAYSAQHSTSASTTTQAQVHQTGGNDRTGGRSSGLALASFIVLLLAAPLVFGYGLQVVALNACGLAWVGWLARRALVGRRRAAAKGGRPR